MQWTEDGGVAILALSGEVDLKVSPSLRQELLARLGNGADVIVDMSGVTYIDSSTVASFVSAFQTARQSGRKFVLAAMSESTLRVLELARLDRVFVLAPTVDDARSV